MRPGSRSDRERSPRRTGRCRRRGAAARGRLPPIPPRPVTAGLKTADPQALGGQRAGDRRGDHGLSHLGAGAGYEDAAQAASSSHGVASRRSGSTHWSFVPLLEQVRRRTGQQSDLAGRVAEHLRGPHQLRAAMGRHRRQPQARGPLGHGRRPDPLREDAAFERLLAELHRRLRLTDDHRNDLGLRRAQRQALGDQARRASLSHSPAASRRGEDSNRGAPAPRARRRPPAAPARWRR